MRGGPGWAAAVLTLAVLVMAVWGAREERVPPPPAPENVSDTAFSSGRAMAQLEELAREPRPLGSPEHTRVRERIVAELEALGVEPEIHTSVAVREAGAAAVGADAEDGGSGAAGPAWEAVTVRNVVARIPGVDSTGTVGLVSHYDGVPLSPAAGDAGAGIVTVLEVARALQAGPPPANDVLLLLTDAEELGLLGAHRFAQEHPWMDDLSVVLNLEMRGGGGPSHMFETGAENGWIVEVMESEDPHPWATSLSVEVYRRMPNDTDFTVFREAGVQGLNFAGIHRPWVYHQPTDAVENLQEATVQHKGARVLALARALGARDLTSVEAPDRAFTTAPVLGLVSYPVGWTALISLALALLWGALFVGVARRGRAWGPTLLGSGIVVGVALGGGALGWALMGWLPRFHPEYGSLVTSFYGEGWYVTGLAALTVALAVGALNLAGGRFSLAALAAGALAVPVVGAVVLSVTVPLTAVELQAPAALGVAAAAILALGEGRALGGGLRPLAHGAALALAALALVWIVPLTEGLWMASGFQGAPALGVLMGLLVACLVPGLKGLSLPNRWWGPAGIALAGIALIGAGVLQAGPSADRPVHSTLLYALERGDEEEAIWATREDPGYTWAQEQVGPFDDERDLAPFQAPGRYRTAPAPVEEVPAPEVALTDAPEEEGEGRTYGISVRSEAGAERVTVAGHADGEAGGANGEAGDAHGGIRITAVEGAAVGGSQGAGQVTHEGEPQDGGLTLEVTAPEGADELALVVVEEHLRPWTFLGDEPFQRPPHLIPNLWTGSDRLLIRTPVRLPVDDPVE